MLLELAVKNFGIIEDITWKPSQGLNVITGETGAGKSLVVDAVGALLSGQVNEENIRHGSEDALVEGIFHIPHNRVLEQLQALFLEKGIQLEDGTIIFTCTLRRQSRNSLRINSQAIPRPVLQEIGASLADIHGQSGHLLLLDRERHLDFLDSYAHTWDLRHDFSAMASELHQVERELQTLSNAEKDMSRQTELLRFQIDEIKEAELKENEEEALEREFAILTSGEKLKTASYEIYSIIHGDDNMLALSSVIDRIGEALLLLKKMMEIDSSLQTRLEQLESTAYSLEELAHEVHSYGDNLDYDRHRLEEVQNRLELIKNLKRKYGASTSEIIDYLINAEEELEGITYSGERHEQLEEKSEQLKRDMGVQAFQLSQARIKAAQKLETAATKELRDLEMSGMDFNVSIHQDYAPEGIFCPDGRQYLFSSSGIDTVEFMASTNPGEPLKPLARIASTGEISRFMLALKCALAEADTTPVLIFDEIDIGIGGRSGEIIGRKLWDLSKNHQVTCVTHLPQIAAFADSHYSVSKENTGNRTISRIMALKGEDRLNELAAMIGGPHFAANSLEAAREILQKADSWKGSSGVK